MKGGLLRNVYIVRLLLCNLEGVVLSAETSYTRLQVCSCIKKEKQGEEIEENGTG